MKVQKFACPQFSTCEDKQKLNNPNVEHNIFIYHLCQGDSIFGHSLVNELEKPFYHSISQNSHSESYN
jgi:hypothetical protein